jgi:hypothetical protein
MTEEIYNKATNLRSLIEKDKKALKYWKEAVDATEETITLSNGLGYNGYDGWRFDDTINKFTFADGTTFGVKEVK